MRSFRALTAAAVLTLCGGCSVAGGPAELPAAAVAAPCAETAPTPPPERPPALAANTSNWYGQGDLWVALPDYPPVPQGDALVLKFPMVTLVDGLPTASRGVRPYGGDGGCAAGEAPGQVSGFAQAFGTTDLSFWPASVAFPSPGCWTVTGLLAAESVQFTLSVEEP
jgi:hypothetical protein